MDRNVAQLGWTDTQWNVVLKTVSEEAQRARVAAQFLPITGPVDASTVAVPRFAITAGANPEPPPPLRLEVNSFPDLAFTTIAVPVELQNHEVADPDLTAALVKFRRAANIIGRIEDATVFNDRIFPGPPATGIAGIPAVYRVTGGGPAPGSAFQFGLLPLDLGGGRLTPPSGRHLVPIPIPRPIPPFGLGKMAALVDYGSIIVDGIVRAMSALENAGQSGPFACALAPLPYEAVYTPNTNFVAAKDRILPILGGPLFRSSSITGIIGVPPGGYSYGVVVALGASPIELIVASDISACFVQKTPEPRYVLRVSERIALRVSEPRAIAVLAP